MIPGTSIPGTCNVCHNMLSSNQNRDRRRRCIWARIGPSVNAPDGAQYHDLSLVTVHISVRAQESTHWIKPDVRSGTILAGTLYGRRLQ